MGNALKVGLFSIFNFEIMRAKLTHSNIKMWLP